MTSRFTTAVALALFLLGSMAAYAQTTPAQEVEAACKADVARLCPNVPPGGGKIAECLKAQKAQVSFGCKRALYRAKQAHDAEAAAAAQSAPPH